LRRTNEEGLRMSDQLLPENSASFRGKWLVRLWMLSTVLGMTAW
jgi:hypothetical protein